MMTYIAEYKRPDGQTAEVGRGANYQTMADNIGQFLAHSPQEVRDAVYLGITIRTVTS